MRHVAHLGVRTLLFPLIEAIWCLLFAVVGALWRPWLTRALPSGNDTILVLAPHPDDETIGCGGAIALHTCAGDRVVVCIVTDGSKSRAGGLSRVTMAATRRIESEKAVAQLGRPELVQLGLPEGTWRNADLEASLTGLLKTLQPAVIYSTSIVDYHPEHIRVSKCLSSVLERSDAGQRPVVRLYEVQVPLTPLLVNTRLEIARVNGAKQSALRAYRTQAQSLVWLRRYSRYQQLLYRTPDTSELFCELPPNVYIAMTKRSHLQGMPYRGMRPRPFADMAPWVAGTRARLRLRHLIMGSRNPSGKRYGHYRGPMTFQLAQSTPWKLLLRRAGKRLLVLRYRHFTPESEPDGTARVAGLELLVLRGVFDPSVHFTSGVLAGYLRSPGVVKPGTSVLDVGTGTGVAAISAALAGARRVVASDINPAAVVCARYNVLSYGLESIVTTRQADMFAGLEGEAFELVICNPPYFPGEPQSMADRAFRAGHDLEWLRRFGSELGAHLKPSGAAIISIGDAADIAGIMEILTACGWSHSEVARRDILVETIYLFRLTRAQEESDRAGHVAG